MNTCDKSYDPERCCCNCEHQLELFKHPLNKGKLKGRILESTKLFCCTVCHKMDKSYKGIIFDNEHGSCEMWCKKGDN
jgi:hypothetical protein